MQQRSLWQRTCHRRNEPVPVAEKYHTVRILVVPAQEKNDAMQSTRTMQTSKQPKIQRKNSKSNHTTKNETKWSRKQQPQQLQGNIRESKSNSSNNSRSTRVASNMSMHVCKSAEAKQHNMNGIHFTLKRHPIHKA